LAKNSTQEEITTFLEQACSELGEYAQMCKALVDQYEPVILSVCRTKEEYFTTDMVTSVAAIFELCAGRKMRRNFTLYPRDRS